jgi:hypothetical protein
MKLFFWIKQPEWLLKMSRQEHKSTDSKDCPCPNMTAKNRFLSTTGYEQISVSWPAVVEKGPISSGYLGWLSAGEESTTLDGSFMFSCRTSKWNPSILEPVNVITCWFHLLETMRSCRLEMRSLRSGWSFSYMAISEKGPWVEMRSNFEQSFSLTKHPLPNHGLVGGV